ncbi:MAG TPA: hypothetical protein VGD64_00790 [Acidisarcina sp.]
MGRVTPEHVYHILWAANRYSNNQDPATDINHYLIVNRQLTPNVRTDSGQPDGWRDYQQILSELGLLYSLQVVSKITATPLGLSLLDGSLGFSETMTLQALRMQYPNGQHVGMSAAQASDLAGSSYANSESFAMLQSLAGVMIRPTVLIWRLLRRLKELSTPAEITIDELESYAMRCFRNSDFVICAAAISAARTGGPVLPRMGGRQRRNAQDWFKFLRLTALFSVRGSKNPKLSLSPFGNMHAIEIDAICSALEEPTTFWQPGDASNIERLRWYSQFGGVDLSIPELPPVELTQGDHEFVGGAEEEEAKLDLGTTEGHLQLREFNGVVFQANPVSDLSIHSIYKADLTLSAHRLHDQMVLLIAQTCRSRGAAVFDDPRSVDLLVMHQGREFIIEVKSVTPRNFMARLRYALGQVLHYDFLRARESALPRRKVIALAADLQDNFWPVEFLNTHLDMDLLTLKAGKLFIHSPATSSNELFSSSPN